MSMRNGLLFSLMLLAPFAAAAEGPGLGVAVPAHELAAISANVFPDGDGLPPGSGNAVQGEQIYATHCAACHGTGGQGGPNDRLAGGRDSIMSEKPVRTVGSYWPYATTIFDYVRRAMPLQTPDVLSDDEVYAVTAYLLHINGIIPRNRVISAENLAGVRMPNRRRFSWPAGEAD